MTIKTAMNHILARHKKMFMALAGIGMVVTLLLFQNCSSTKSENVTTSSSKFTSFYPSLLPANALRSGNSLQSASSITFTAAVFDKSWRESGFSKADRILKNFTKVEALSSEETNKRILVGENLSVELQTTSCEIKSGTLQGDLPCRVAAQLYYSASKIQTVFSEMGYAAVVAPIKIIMLDECGAHHGGGDTITIMACLKKVGQGQGLVTEDTLLIHLATVVAHEFTHILQGTANNFMSRMVAGNSYGTNIVEAMASLFPAIIYKVEALGQREIDILPVYDERAKFGRIGGQRYDQPIPLTSVLFKLAQEYIGKSQDVDAAVTGILYLYTNRILALDPDTFVSRDLLIAIRSQLEPISQGLARLCQDLSIQHGLDLDNPNYDGHTSGVAINDKSIERRYKIDVNPFTENLKLNVMSGLFPAGTNKKYHVVLLPYNDMKADSALSACINEFLPACLKDQNCLTTVAQLFGLATSDGASILQFLSQPSINMGNFLKVQCIKKITSPLITLDKDKKRNLSIDLKQSGSAYSRYILSDHQTTLSLESPLNSAGDLCPQEKVGGFGVYFYDENFDSVIEVGLPKVICESTGPVVAFDSELNLTNEQRQILGDWKTSCIALGQGLGSVMYTLSISGTSLVQTQTTFQDSACSTNAQQLQQIASYKMTAVATNTTVNLTVSQVNLAMMNQSHVNLANSGNAYGYSNWETQIPKDISGRNSNQNCTNCNPLKIGQNIQYPYSLDGQVLRFNQMPYTKN